jgi:hypothetical protein
MNWGGFLATGLRSLANVLAGNGPGLAPTGAAADVSTGIGASISVLKEIEARKLTIGDAASFANAVQQILVDLDVEPGIVLSASKLLEAVAPALVGAWRSGIITGGYPDIVAQENDPNFKNR